MNVRICAAIALVSMATACDIGVDDLPPTPDLEIAVNAGWIGGPCIDDADCDYDDGVCLRDDEGFPRGHCSLDCEQTCPDRGGMPITFCVEGVLADGGGCTQRCDHDAFGPAGCRAGYRCLLQPRQGQPGVERHVCLPGESQPTVADP